MNLNLKFIAILLISVCYTNLSFCQNLEDTQKKLMLSKKKRQRIVKLNRKVTVFFKDESKANIKGRLKEVNEDYIIVGSQEIFVDEIDKMRVPNLAVRIVGGVLAVPGSFFLGIGTALVGYGLSNQIEDGLAALAGGLVIIVAIIPTIVGYALLLSGKKYKTNKGWEIKIV